MTNEEAVTYGNELIQCSTGPLREFAELATRALRSPAPGAVAMREAAARLCNLRSCTWSKSDDERSQDFREGIETAAHQLRDAIRALPAPEVPEAVKAWVASYDDEATAGAHHLAVDDAIREWIRQEYGL